MSKKKIMADYSGSTSTGGEIRNFTITNTSDLYPQTLSIVEFDRFMKHVIGQMLTIVEATTHDNTQRESVKSLVRNVLHAEADKVANWMAEQDGNQAGSFPY